MVNLSAQRASEIELVSEGEASKILHVHPNTLRRWSDSGLIPTYRTGKRRDWRFAVDDLVAFMERSANCGSKFWEPSYSA